MWNYYLYIIAFGLMGYVESQTVPAVNKCDTANPIYECFVSVRAGIANAGPNTTAYCRAIKNYVTCVENIACECKLGTSGLVLQTLTQNIEIFKFYNCSIEIKEVVTTSAGISCPGQPAPGSANDVGLTVLSLDTLQNVVTLDLLCPGVKACYKKLSDDAGIAIYSKNLRSYCSAIEEFLPCLEETTCNCGQKGNEIFRSTVRNERAVYNQVCTILTNGVYFEDVIKCKGDVPIDVCTRNNPAYECYIEYDKAIFRNLNDVNTRCPAFKDYINCTEATACTCGLTKSPIMLRELTLAIDNYKSQGCPAVSGSIEVKFGINCPNSGTGSDNVLTSLGLLEIGSVLQAIKDCHGLEQCYRASDTDTAKALHEKNATAMCKASSEFVHCSEQAACQCGRYLDANFQNSLLTAKSNHLSICPTDSTIQQVYRCNVCANNTNPVSGCFAEFSAAASDLTNKDEACPAHKKVLICLESVACSCGFKSSPVILQQLAFAHNYYDTQGCDVISGEYAKIPGINCPHFTVSYETEELTTLGLTQTTNTLAVINLCPDFEICVKVVDAAAAKALHEKDAPAYCAAETTYLHCAYKASCNCTKGQEKEYQDFLTTQVKLHLQICPEDTTLTDPFVCHGSTIQMSVTVMLFSMVWKLFIQ